MRYLLDTHIIIWMLENNAKLSDKVRTIINDADNQVFYSTVSIWETSIKKMAHPDQINLSGSKLSELCSASGLNALPIYNRHIRSLEMLDTDNTSIHKDPFDRMLIAQAKSDNMILITHDSKIAEYNEKCIMRI